jgi:hypothetical protein
MKTMTDSIISYIEIRVNVFPLQRIRCGLPRTENSIHGVLTEGVVLILAAY